MELKGRTLSSGTALQSGLARDARTQSGGMSGFVRGVVIATYVTDDPANPDAATGTSPTAVYCDVLTYSSTNGAQRVVWPRCLVCLDFGGMQSGVIHRPRAATLDVSGAPLDLLSCAIGQIDGDHVLCSVIDGNMSQPVIIRGLPHPSSDVSNTALQGQAGAHLQLKQVDGSPYTVKHNGSFFGITGAGDIQHSTLFANAGNLTSTGAEPPPPTDATLGNQVYKLHAQALALTQFYDMSTPTAPVVALQRVLSATKSLHNFVANPTDMQVQDSGGNSMHLQKSGAQATLAVGTGAVHVAIAEHLQVLYSALQTWLVGHAHPTAFGLSGLPIAPIPPNWDPSVNSTHISLPDG